MHEPDGPGGFARLCRSSVFRWSIGLLLTITWFATLGMRTLVPTDEGRYAEMAREMLATGDWVTTRLNGIKYFEKPPLQIWMTALAFKLFGLGEWQARLWTGVCGYAGIVLTGIAGARVFGREAGLFAALVLGATLLWGAGGHINSLDMGLAAGMTLALAGMLVAQGGRQESAACIPGVSAASVTSAGASSASGIWSTRSRWMLACWAGMGLAVMSKGLIGLALPGAVLVAYSILLRDLAIWKRLHVVPGLVLFAAITVPWFVMVSLRNPGFLHFFFIHEHFQRFTSEVHAREGPWHYFFPILLAGVMPWLAVLAQSLWAARHEQPHGAGGEAGRMMPDQVFQPKKLLLVWSVVIFVFFSLSGSKLPAYILPIFPALAILIALHLQTAPQRSWWFLAGSMAALGIILLALVPRLPQLAGDAEAAVHFKSAQPWLAAAALTLLAGAMPVLWWCRQRRQEIALQATLLLATAGFVALQLIMIGAEAHGRARAGLALLPALRAELTPHTPLYAVGMYDQTLPFYLERTTTLVVHPDELAFGLGQQPELWLPTLEAFVMQWRSGPKAVAIARPYMFERLQSQGVPMRVVARDRTRIIITNR